MTMCAPTWRRTSVSARATMRPRAPRPIASSARRFRYDHGASSPMETRGIVANWDARANQLTVWDTTQAPVFLRNGLAGMLGLSERQVRVIAPFVGGGFGPKIMLFYPEEVVLPWAASELNRPMKWIEDRLEHFFATTHERGQTHDAEMALSRDGRILGIKDMFLHDTGAYDPYGLTVPINWQCTLARALCGAELRFDVHRRLHQQADRHALSRRRAPARRVRDRAAAGYRRARVEASIAPRSAAAISFRRMRFRTTTRSSIRTSRRSPTTAAITSRSSTRRWR